MSILKSYLTLLILSTLFLSYGNATSSGFYVDNGIDQTIMKNRLVNSQEMEGVELEILQLLNLPGRPSLVKQRPNRKLAPNYLVDIYKSLTDKSSGQRFRRSVSAENELFAVAKRVAIEESDVIMTFIGMENVTSKGRSLFFNMSKVTNSLTLLMAEFRIYQNGTLNRWNNEEYTVCVDLITETNGKRNFELLTSTSTRSNYQGWLELNVTDGLSKVLERGKDIFGLYVSVQNRSDDAVNLSNFGLIESYDIEFQPMVVGYFNEQSSVKPPTHSRVKRSSARRRKKSEMKNPFVQTDPVVDTSKNCRIQTLYVSFRDLSWHDWIIAPDGFGAFFCSGECNFPLNSQMNATNHAIVQTLVHLMHPTKIPKPCCAPTELSSISVLYYVDDASINLKKYRNMVVESCGCH